MLCAIWPAQPVSAQPVPIQPVPDALTSPFVCPDLAEPIIRLDYGSRYSSTDKSRSDFDSASNAEVNAQLKPVDRFITDMILAANMALLTADTVPANCVKSGLLAWAKVGALEQTESLNSKLSVPSRLAGLAFAWDEVKPMVAVDADSAVIEAWLATMARSSMTFFDTEAPPKSQKNNLRAWAALAVTRVGLTLGDPDLIDWADASLRLVICTADTDGSLPLEMARKGLALHYQIHALTALVPAAVLMQEQGRDIFDACDGSLHRSIRFARTAFEDATAVTRLAKSKQSYFDGSDTLQGFELAWAAPYLAKFPDPDLAKFIAPYGALANSKIGGLQALLWQDLP